MPTSATVLESLTRISRELWWLAAVWHVLTGALLLAFAMGWRPGRNRVGAALGIPLLSVSLAAWSYGNPFNGLLFLLIGVATCLLAWRSDPAAITVSSTGRVLLGASMIAFGWLYPHFLDEGSGLRYLWAAPLGLIPCPTLSLIVGIAILLENGTSRTLKVLWGGMGAFYGALGWLWLGVTIDVVLVIGSASLLASRDDLAHGRGKRLAAPLPEADAGPSAGRRP